MRAMILAAGRGARMRPLTDTCPKPLLKVRGKSMLARLIGQLVQAGLSDIVINHAWLGEQIEATIGDGADQGARIVYSPETSALETAGGIANALPLLGDQPFLVVNGDIVTDFEFALAHRWRERVQTGVCDAVCTLVANPAHNQAGDFVIDEHGLVRNPDEHTPAQSMTYAGIAVFAPAFFADIAPGEPTPLAPLLRASADQSRLAGYAFAGSWSDVGSPERLAELNASTTD